MKRIGVLAIILILKTGVFTSCEEKAVEQQATGVWLRFSNCVAFPASVFINDEYWGRVSSEEPALIEIPAGSYSVYVHSNAILADEEKYFCWTESVSVSDGSAIDLFLDCSGALCPPD